MSRASEPRLSRRPRSPRRARLPRWRLLLCLLCLAGFLVFLLPVFGGILNIANEAAMAGFLALAAVFRWWPGFLRGLGWFWKRLWGRVLLLVTGAGLAALTLLVGLLCCLVIGRLHAVPQTPCPTVIVLGCQVRGATPSLMLSYRIRAAADYLKANPEAAAILSGGQGSGENITEAACMYEGLVAAGIDPGRLYLEETSTTTQENLRFSRALMEREGLSGPVAIVSNDFHICRALTMAGDLGLEAEGLAARSDYWFSRPTYILREALALVYYLLSG